jgi:hypothetical protein
VKKQFNPNSLRFFFRKAAHVLLLPANPKGTGKVKGLSELKSTSTGQKSSRSFPRKQRVRFPYSENSKKAFQVALTIAFM